MEKMISKEESEIRDRVASLFERDKIRARRKAKEVSVFCGIAQSAVSKWIEKKATPEAHSIIMIARYFSVSPCWILTGEYQPKKITEIQT